MKKWSRLILCILIMLTISVVMKFAVFIEFYTRIKHLPNAAPLEIRSSNANSTSMVQRETTQEFHDYQEIAQKKEGSLVDYLETSSSVYTEQLRIRSSIQTTRKRSTAQTEQDDVLCRRRLPNGIIVGVMKCGTQALTDFLSIHPNIAMKKDEPTVIFFNQRYEEGTEWYRQQMPCSKPGQVTIEKSPQYFQNSKAPGRIFELDKNMKILLIVREPVKRAISHLGQIESVNPYKIKGNGTFESEVIDENGNVIEDSLLIQTSIYSNSMREWLKVFARKNIHIVDGDMFARNIVEEYRKIEKFLELPNYLDSNVFVFDEEKGFYCMKPQNDVICLSSGKGRKHPDVDPYVITKLKSYFRPYNEEFFELIGQRFNWNDQL